MNHTCIFVCAIGYSLEDDPNRISFQFVCQANGTWSGKIHKCVGKLAPNKFWRNYFKQFWTILWNVLPGSIYLNVITLRILLINPWDSYCSMTTKQHVSFRREREARFRYDIFSFRRSLNGILSQKVGKKYCVHIRIAQSKDQKPQKASKWSKVSEHNDYNDSKSKTKSTVCAYNHRRNRETHVSRLLSTRKGAWIVNEVGNV